MSININDEYFEWMYRIACGDRYASGVTYRKLFKTLHDIEFVYSIPRDENRAQDGIDLRYRFSVDQGYQEDLTDFIGGPCSVLEMILALAIRCEESIMDDPAYGDRTSQWFWQMLNNLGVGNMYDTRFNRSYVRGAINRLLDREYDPDGKGGLFRIRGCEDDLREVEIWYQLCWYLDTIV